MKNFIQGRWPGRYADNRDMKVLLGLRAEQKLPRESTSERLVQGVRVYVKPSEPRTGYKSSKHRITVICECGIHVSAGRLHQHKCKE